MATHTVPEEWRSVVGYEGIYSVSSFGRVRRDCGGHGTRGVMRQLKPYPKRGYMLARFDRRLWYIHRLVAEAFIGPRPDRHEVNHINGNKADNRPVNLEYVTHRENMRHAREVLNAPLPPGVPGEQHWNARLTTDQVRAIRAAYPTQTQRAIAAQYGVHPAAISDIVCRRKWKHVA